MKRRRNLYLTDSSFELFSELVGPRNVSPKLDEIISQINVNEQRGRILIAQAFEMHTNHELGHENHDFESCPSPVCQAARMLEKLLP